MRYRRDLDGLRAIAVLAVIASHTEVRYTYGGWMGVDVFFVLSGFLITSLLVMERQASGHISLKHFYARRALRLYPALVATILFVGAWFAVGAGYGLATSYWHSAFRSALYLENFFAGGNSPGYLPHTWSLAIEEQFYLLWPPVLALLLWAKRDPLPWAFFGASVSCALASHYMLQGGAGYNAAYYLPQSRFGELLLGGMLALAVVRGVEAPGIIRRRYGGPLLALAGIGLVYLAQYEVRIPNLAWEAPAIALVTAATVWHLTVNESSPIRRLLEATPLHWLGRRSYGIYLIHLPTWYLIQVHVHAPRVVLCGLMVASTLVLADLSYRFVEMPFLRKKERFGAKHEPDETRRLRRPRPDGCTTTAAEAGASV